jgi:flagellar protein FliS
MYASTQNETASRERLMVLLFEAALRHIRASASAFDGGRPEGAAVPLKKATDIVTELMTTLDRSRDPELADRLGGIYGFVCDRLIEASTSLSAAPVREAERAFAPIVDGFATAVAKLEQAGAAAAK